MVYTDHVEIWPDGSMGEKGQRCAIPFSKNRLLVDFMTFHFRLLRRSVYQQVGGVEPSSRQAVDYDRPSYRTLLAN